MKRLVIVGGGILGLASAVKARQANLAEQIVVLEKESKVGAHQSSHNSGVLHCGLYYRLGSLKARLAVRGIREMVAFCEEEGVPHEVCGKIVLAVNEEEAARLKDLHERGQANGLKAPALAGRKGDRGLRAARAWHGGPSCAGRGHRRLPSGDGTDEDPA